MANKCKICIFCVQSGKLYTGHKFFIRALPVVPVTNMRYAEGGPATEEETSFGWPKHRT